MFWCERTTFDALAGFDASLLSDEDFNFGIQLKRFGKKRGLRYGTLWRDGITTSCRKFDQYGDWYLFRNPQLVRPLMKGKDRSAADGFYYDIDR